MVVKDKRLLKDKQTGAVYLGNLAGTFQVVLKPFIDTTEADRTMKTTRVRYSSSIYSTHTSITLSVSLSQVETCVEDETSECSVHGWNLQGCEGERENGM